MEDEPDFRGIAEALVKAHMAAMIFVLLTERNGEWERLWALPKGPQEIDFDYRRGKSCDFLWPVGGFIKQVKL